MNLVDLKEEMLKKYVKAFYHGGNSVFWYQGHLCDPNFNFFREHILLESYNSRYLSPSSQRDVLRLLEVVLVEWDEEGYCSISG